MPFRWVLSHLPGTLIYFSKGSYSNFGLISFPSRGRAPGQVLCGLARSRAADCLQLIHVSTPGLPADDAFYLGVSRATGSHLQDAHGPRGDPEAVHPLHADRFHSGTRPACSLTRGQWPQHLCQQFSSALLLAHALDLLAASRSLRQYLDKDELQKTAGAICST